MTPERLQQIEELYHAARPKDASARATFLAATCAGDDALRQEVESLLNQPSAFGDPMDIPDTGSLFVEDLTGRRLGQFRVESLLREGGMARVYRGYQESVDRAVALKVLPRQYSTDPQFLERFRQEARIVGNLQHPHILSVFDHGESEGYTFLAMPLVETGTLADVLARGRISFFDAERITTQVCEALDYAHSRGIVHRDIKPGNILIDSDGNAFVADFGIAKILSSSGSLTQTGLFLGSPIYMSPEQMTDGDVGPHSDFYSLGMVLYEMLAGKVPFKTDGPFTSVSKLLNEPLPSPKLHNPEVTPELEAVVLKAIARSKGDRFPNGRQLASALSAAVRQFELQKTTLAQPGAGMVPAADRAAAVFQGITLAEPSPEIKSPPKRRAATMLLWVAASIAVVSLAIVGGMRTLRDAGRQPQSLARPPENVPLTAPQPTSPEQPPTQASASTALPSPTAGSPSAGATSAASSAPTRGGASPQPAGGSASRDASVPDAPRSGGLTAKQMYAASAGAENGSPGLKYRIIEKRVSGEEVDADPARTFHSGERVRFAFESNMDGYLYVVQRGSTGQWTVLFPDPDANGGRNAIRRSEAYFVPNNGWFAFDETPGTEEVFVVLSKQSLDTLPGFDAPVIRRERVDTAVVDALQRSIQSRDLVFEKERPAVVDGRTSQATYVVNRNELASRVAAFIPLTHAR